MYNELIEELEIEVKKRCESKDNFFGPTAFYHIESIVKNAKYLAKIYNANVEIVTIAAWLHDIASITRKEYYEEHHIYMVHKLQK